MPSFLYKHMPTNFKPDTRIPDTHDEGKEMKKGYPKSLINYMHI